MSHHMFFPKNLFHRGWVLIWDLTVDKAELAFRELEYKSSPVCAPCLQPVSYVENTMVQPYRSEGG